MGILYAGKRGKKNPNLVGGGSKRKRRGTRPGEDPSRVLERGEEERLSSKKKGERERWLGEGGENNEAYDFRKPKR